MTMTLTGPARMASALLENKTGLTLAVFLKHRRRAGISYERIAQELNRVTDGVVAVTGETVRNWATDLQAVAS